ncbi:hypothetical protein LU699_17080 [Luteimonas fraxinea]|uniref:Uncharacterized protein n=1 Tax=Luteimonas fraxinea TaxID=2901869 RepID=A0ABS8UAY1_9GAMM|nr:hypothetical protein [Luteimonas fraxinea]MCD9096651.1 hypothetical protein [Luteimonas fraxinea]UHH09945.1 hypothetical protein LU699_17080 [Luteimonas fraxinea]
MKRTKSVWIAIAVIGAIGAGIAWNEMRLGFDAARASHASPVAAPSNPPAESSASTIASAPTRDSRPPVTGVDQSRTVSAEQGASAANAKFLLARALVLDHLRDPSTAEFRNERALQGGEIVCMEVNSKDGFGGDVGYTQAVVISRPGVAPVVWVDDARQNVARAACETA